MVSSQSIPNPNIYSSQLTNYPPGNVRQEFLVCVRQAIEIGAALIRPNIMLRSEGLIEYQNGPVHNMSYLFNLELFDARLRSACPHMPIYNDIAEVERVGEIAKVDRPWDLPEEQGVKLSFTAWAKLNRQQEGKITVFTMPRITGQTYVSLSPPFPITPSLIRISY